MPILPTGTNKYQILVSMKLFSTFQATHQQGWQSSAVVFLYSLTHPSQFGIPNHPFILFHTN